MSKPWRPSLSQAERELIAGGVRDGQPHYDRAGEPISFADWVEAFEDADYRRVALDVVGPYEVSTVWLGLDHGFGQGPPLLFETMVFRRSGGERWDDLDQRRYSTEAEALAGHAEVVNEVALLVAAGDD